LPTHRMRKGHSGIRAAESVRRGGFSQQGMELLCTQSTERCQERM
jgi:hypothetical protein